MSVTINTTLATLRNISTTVTYWPQVIRPNISLNSSAPSYVTEWTPFVGGGGWTNQINCPQCYQQTQDDSYTYTYIYYCLLLLLLVVAIVCIKLGVQRRNELIRRAAIQRAARLQSANANVISNSTNNSNYNNNNQMGPKENDLPPAYDDIIPPDFMAKQSLPNQADSSAISETSNLPAAISTLTIATDISSNISSDLEPNNVANSTANLGNNRPLVIAPTSASETRIDITSNVESNENIV